ncbi:hypothetical protein [Mammaliicoccus sp. N-M50]|uniref:hypothetical protein n=1 Tax=Mammaliicoccus sp. N-M50 TaxID=2898709 RepID=UPI001EFB0A6A|nr:hypothetical protein [Mammaliicoccus sp. N-M50]
MYDIKKIVELAKEVGFEVESASNNNEGGFYSKNENGEIEKWDALSAFDLKKSKRQNKEYQNNYFNKYSYTKAANNFSYNTPNSKKDGFPSKENTNDPLITEAA